MAEHIQCGHCGTAIEVPEAVLAQGLAAVVEFDAACARDCQEVAHIEDSIKCSALAAGGFIFGMGFGVETPEGRQAVEEIDRSIAEAKSKIEELERRMGHRLPEFRRNMSAYRYCPCCQRVLPVPEALCMQGEDAIEAFLARCAEDCRRATEIEQQKESRAGADLALATMAQGDTTGEYGRQAMDTFRAQEEEIRKEDEELALLCKRMAHVPYRYRSVPAMASGAAVSGENPTSSGANEQHPGTADKPDRELRFFGAITAVLALCMLALYLIFERNV